ncbi:MAG TPA: efflux RND transporter permease subunit [Syntrophomonadaceae bacterium]|nr:efflux RND transporter permease subunit [Syntrophomonadaceae bacterium]
MHLTELAIKRPKMMTTIILVFVVLGLYTYGQIGVELFPAVNIPVVSVRVSYPGAGAEEIEGQIIKPIEDALSSLSGLKQTTSTASTGSGSVNLEFDLSANANQALMDVQKKVDAVRGRLPDGAGDPVVMKMDMNDAPVLTMALSGNRPLNELYDIANDTVVDRLQRVAGVAQVSINGGKQREIEINLNKSKMEGFGLSINQVITRLSSENLNDPSGRLDRPEAEYNVRVLGEYRSVQEISNIQIPTSSGYAVPLKEIATVVDGFAEVRQYSRLNSQDAIGIQISKQSDASVVATANGVKKELAAIEKDLPSDCKIVISNDSADFVQKTLNGTIGTIIEGIICTGIILFLFLRKWRPTVIVMMAIPTSLLATLMMISFAGFTFNMMSLMGLALCIGILVDDSIVVLENIDRHWAMGKLPAVAALEGRSEIGMAAIAITLSDVVVFVPIAFMSGMVGQFFRQFGLTIVFATLFSLFVSFTMTPMLASLLYKPKDESDNKDENRRSKLDFIWRRIIPWGSNLKSGYVTLLAWTMNHRKRVLAFSVLAFFLSLTVVPLGLVSTEFMPKSDQGAISISLEMPQGTPLAKTDDGLKQIENYVKQIPEVQYYQTSLGSGGRGSSSGANSGRMSLKLYPKTERKRTIWDIGDSIRKWSKGFTGGKITVSESDSMVPGGGGGGSSTVQIIVKGKDQDQLTQISEKIKNIVAQTTGAADVDSNWRLGQPEIEVQPDRARTAYYGLSLNDITRTVRTAINGATAGVYRQGDKETDINVKLDGADQQDINNLKNILVTGTNGSAPLGQVASINYGSGPKDIRRVDRQRAITVSGSVRNRPLGEFMNEVKGKISQLSLPSGFSVTYGGQDQNMADTTGPLLSALALSILLVYMILIMLYESFSTPLIRMLSLPFGIVGALITLAIFRNNLNIFSMIGIIMLDGLVAKNGTLLIDYTHTLMDRGRTLREALVEAGITRLRPILMTTITMVVGMLPTALALTEGAEMRSGMAWVLIGGLLTSTLFTLFIIPIVYTLIDDWKVRRQKQRTGRNQVLEPSETSL